MILKGTSDNNVVTTQGENWLYKSDEPINRHKIYFEVVAHSRPAYSTGTIGISDFIGKNGYTHINYQGAAPFAFANSVSWYTTLGYWCTATDYSEVYPEDASLSYVGKTMGYGYTLKKDGTKLDVYVDDELKLSYSTKIIFDPAKTYVATFNTWSHNSQNATYYFDSDVKYKATAKKYRADKKIYLCDNQLYGVK